MQTRQAAPGRSGRPDAQATEALNRRIWDTATRLFIEHGYAATSVEQIAMAVRSSKATIYRRHSSKEELFAAVIRDMGSTILETATAAEQAERKASDPLASLRAVCGLQLDLIARP